MAKKAPAVATPQDSPDIKDVTRYPIIQEYMNMYGWKLHPMSQAFIDKLASEVITWAQNEDVWKISQFYSSRGVERSTWYEWINKYPILMRAHKGALTILGDRREIGALKKNLDSKMVTMTMPFYDPEWKEAEEWRAKMRDEQKEADNAQRIVVIERFPDSDLVPKKESK